MVRGDGEAIACKDLACKMETPTYVKCFSNVEYLRVGNASKEEQNVKGDYAYRKVMTINLESVDVENTFCTLHSLLTLYHAGFGLVDQRYYS